MKKEEEVKINKKTTLREDLYYTILFNSSQTRVDTEKNKVYYGYTEEDVCTLTDEILKKYGLNGDIEISIPEPIETVLDILKKLNVSTDENYKYRDLDEIILLLEKML